jgi:hypothetical protein
MHASVEVWASQAGLKAGCLTTYYSFERILCVCAYACACVCAKNCEHVCMHVWVVTGSVAALKALKASCT